MRARKIGGAVLFEMKEDHGDDLGGKVIDAWRLGLVQLILEVMSTRICCPPSCFTFPVVGGGSRKFYCPCFPCWRFGFLNLSREAYVWRILEAQFVDSFLEDVRRPLVTSSK